MEGKPKQLYEKQGLKKNVVILDMIFVLQKHYSIFARYFTILQDEFYHKNHLCLLSASSLCPSLETHWKSLVALGFWAYGQLKKNSFEKMKYV